MHEILQDLAKRPSRFGKEILHDLAQQSCSCPCKSLASVWHFKTILQDFRGKNLQESGQFTFKIARIVQVLQYVLQGLLLSWSKICSKILQDFFHGTGNRLANALSLAFSVIAFSFAAVTMPYN